MNGDKTSTTSTTNTGDRNRSWTARLAGVVALVAIPLGLTQGVPAANASQPRVREVSATLRTADGTQIGWVRLRSRGGRTMVIAKLQLSNGMTAMNAFHGFHIHANDKPGNGEGCLADPAQPPATWFTSADGHLSEVGQKHSQHAGDLPSLLVNDDGSALIEFTSTRLDLADLPGRAVVLHAGPDNFANIPTGSGPEQYTANSMAAMDKTAASGNAGDRIACGVLKLDR
jgi:Cu-Zn family superoxide dismutase